MLRNDRHDIDRRELKLIMVGHYLWAIYKKECGKSGTVSERRALQEALQQVWERKRELREELSVERQAKVALLRERFRDAGGGGFTGTGSGQSKGFDICHGRGGAK